MKNNFSSRFCCVCSLIFVLLAAAPFWCAANGVKRVLQVESFSAIDPWTEQSTRAFRDTLSEAGIGVNFEIFTFAVRFQPGMRPGFGDIKALQTKLNSQSYDLVVVYSNDAAELFLDGQLKLPKGTPLLLENYNGEPSLDQKRELNMTAVLTVFQPYENARLGLQLLPDIRQVVLLVGATADGLRQCELLRSAPKEISQKITIIDGAQYTTAEMLEKVRELPPHTSINFHSWGAALDETPTNTYAILSQIKQFFPGLILGRYDTYMPLGSAGGFIVIGSEVGKQTGNLAIRILNGEQPAAIPYEYTQTHCRLDYRAIQKFNIPASRIPTGVEIVNTPPDFLIRYRVQLATGGGILFLILSGFIGALLFRLYKQQRKAVMLFDNLPFRVFIFNSREQILYSHIPSSYSEEDEDCLLTHLDQIPSPVIREKIRAAIRQVFENGKPLHVDIEDNGQFRHSEFLRLPGNNPFHTDAVMCISTDTTELHVAHSETARLAERFRLTLESIGDGVIATDAEENVTLLNPVAVEMTGYEQEEAAGKKMDEIFNIVSFIDETKVESPLARALATGRTVELANHTDLIAKDGRRRHIADSASPIRDESGKITGGVLVFRDVTEEYEKRDRLRMNSTILKMVEEIAQLGYFRCSGVGATLLPAPELYWPRRDGQPVSPEEWIAQDDLDGFLKEWRRLLAGETEKLSISFAAGVPKRYFELRAVKSANEISKKVEYCGVIQDVTCSRKTERQVRDNLQLLQNVMDNLPGYIFVKNVEDNFRYVMCNRRFGEMIGVDSDQIPGHSDSEIFRMDEAVARKFHEDDLAVIDSKKKLSIRERFRSVTGNELMVQTVKNAVTQSDGTRLLIGMGIDISREYKLEQQQKRTIESLDYATRCERIINQSLSMITVEPDFDRAINEMLRIIGENAEADRAYIFLYTGEGRFVSNKYEWVRTGTVPQRGLLQKVDMADFPEWEKTLFERKDIVVRDMSAPPPLMKKELKLLVPQGNKSLLVSGIWRNGEMLGFVGLDYTRKRHEFNDTSIHTVQSIANLFLLAHERAAQLEQIADSASLQRQIVNNISIPLLMFDLDYNVEMVNSASRDALSCSIEEVIGKKCYHVACGCDAPPDFCPFEKVKTSKQPVHFDFKNPNGHTYMISFQPLFDRNDKVIHLLETAVDVTELYQQKDDLQKAAEQALAADRAKSYFLATMSHELRTPLNAVIGFSELLQSSDVSREEQLDYLRSINCAGSALLNLINDVLDLSKLEAAQVTIAPVKTDLSKLAEEIIAVFQLKAKQKNIKLLSLLEGVRYPVYVDHLRIRQILLNLVGNAIKFTHEGGITVTIGYHLTTADIGELSIQVADTGIGIAAKSLERIFEPFVQAESTRGNRVYEGSGLGLAISMRLVQRMGGTIDASSEPGMGSTFIVKLQEVRCELREENVPSSGEIAATAILVKEQRMLLVDDVAMNLKVLQAMLRKLKIESVCADSGARALEILKSDSNFDFILTDLWMPGMNGAELLNAIRSDGRIDDVPVIAVTADTEAQNAAGFDAVLMKPVTLEKISHVLMSAKGYK
ncbi:PAS domain-containing protein [Victivallis vadensis]|uniref:PAS domain-containing protein n=1 Tax=Victivallis vadensis TaxID=172901 RepID=UPI0026DC8946|nr:PAS domain-containing protein [Victivallis vadensis]